MRDYKEAKEYLASVKPLGIVPGLDTIRELLKELGDPQKDLKFIHIAGTNGKGSVGAYLSYILAVSGYRVGRYLSPAISDEREKIQILEYIVNEEDNEKNRFLLSWIKEDSIVEHLSQIQEAIHVMKEKGFMNPTVFEIETAMAFLELRKQKCDIVVLETGMGGREDATNIVDNVECSVFVSISMDHMQFLGNTLKQIAEEKAGIIKKKIPIVSSPQKFEVEKILRRKAEEANSEINFVNMDFARNIKHSLNGIDFIYAVRKNEDIQDGSELKIEENRSVHLCLLGSYQVENALTAIETVQVLRNKGYYITWKNIKEGLGSTIWHGRFEVLKKRPLIIVDGAHNEDAAEKLAESIKQYILEDNVNQNGISSNYNMNNDNNYIDKDFKQSNETQVDVSNRKLIYMFGILKDKDIDKVIEKTMKLPDILLTVTPDSKRAFPSNQLKEKVEEFWKKIGKKGVAEDCKCVKYGVQRVLDIATEKDAIVIFGSLSLMHEINNFKETISL